MFSIPLQQTWKEEIRERMRQMQTNTSSGPRFEADLIRRREDELRHAQDIREHYQRKLDKTNDLYLELSAVLLQLEQRERDVVKYDVCHQISRSIERKRIFFSCYFDGKLMREFFFLPAQTRTTIGIQAVQETTGPSTFEGSGKNAEKTKRHGEAFQLVDPHDTHVTHRLSSKSCQGYSLYAIKQFQSTGNRRRRAYQ